MKSQAFTGTSVLVRGVLFQDTRYKNSMALKSFNTKFLENSTSVGLHHKGGSTTDRRQVVNPGTEDLIEQQHRDCDSLI